MVLSTKMKNIIIVRRDYLHFIRKYQKYQKYQHNILLTILKLLKRISYEDIDIIGQCFKNC